MLMLQFLTKAHARKLPVLRRRLDKHTLEEASALSSTVVALKMEVIDQYPIAPEVLDKEFVADFLAGDTNLELELQAVIQEKLPSFKPADLTHLQNIIHGHIASTNNRMQASASTVIQAGALTEVAATCSTHGLHKCLHQHVIHCL